MLNIKYPDVQVHLIGADGNAVGILGQVRRGLRRAGIDNAEIANFTKQATAGDYDHLLRTVMEWVDVR